MAISITFACKLTNTGKKCLWGRDLWLTGCQLTPTRYDWPQPFSGSPRHSRECNISASAPAGFMPHSPVQTHELTQLTTVSHCSLWSWLVQDPICQTQLQECPVCPLFPSRCSSVGDPKLEGDWVVLGNRKGLWGLTPKWLLECFDFQLQFLHNPLASELTQGFKVRVSEMRW